MRRKGFAIAILAMIAACADTQEDNVDSATSPKLYITSVREVMGVCNIELTLYSFTDEGGSIHGFIGAEGARKQKVAGFNWTGCNNGNCKHTGNVEIVIQGENGSRLNYELDLSKANVDTGGIWKSMPANVLGVCTENACTPGIPQAISVRGDFNPCTQTPCHP